MGDPNTDKAAIEITDWTLLVINEIDLPVSHHALFYLLA